jgi:hypothetical protein
VLAARNGKTLNQLLEEGATLVLAKYGARQDREELERRAREARERLRQGIYSETRPAGRRKKTRKR